MTEGCSFLSLSLFWKLYVIDALLLYAQIEYYCHSINKNI